MLKFSLSVKFDCDVRLNAAKCYPEKRFTDFCEKYQAADSEMTKLNTLGHMYQEKKVNKFCICPIEDMAKN